MGWRIRAMKATLNMMAREGLSQEVIHEVMDPKR